MKIPVESRVTIRSLAECALFFRDKQVPIPTKSALICACVDLLASLLKDAGAVEVEDDDKAHNVLEHILGDRPSVDLRQLQLNNGLSSLVKNSQP